MYNYLSKTKGVILDYLTKAQNTEAKIEEGKKIYQADAMEREEKRLRDELMKARKDAEARIESIYQEAASSAREWGKLDGSKLTKDADLLKGEGVTPEQFNVLKERYSDNYTMLDTLRKYGERKNAEATAEARAAGNRDFLIEMPYNIRDIPSPETKVQVWDDMKKQADYFLNVADGTGFSSDYEKSFARNMADKAFEAWGADQKQEPIDQNKAIADFQDIWGFSK